MDRRNKLRLFWLLAPPPFVHIMFFLPSTISAPLVRVLVLVPGLALCPASVLRAGNQNGPGWQQGKTKEKVAKAAKASVVRERKNAPAAFQAPDITSPIPVTPRRTAPEEESIQRSIPGNGLLFEDALVRLAIANNPELARRRAEILIARAKEKGAGDWENPELRIGYAWDQDDRLKEPFIERATERINSSERYTQTQSQSNLAGPFQVGEGDSQLQSTSGGIRASRYRTIERRVTPGRYRDVIDTTVFEHRKANETFRQNTSQTTQGATLNSRESGAQNTDRRIMERARETINHPDNYSRDDQLSLLVRFRVPNPWERRAKIELAAAQTARAESDYLIEEDKVVRTVRAMYEDLNMTESLSRGTVSRKGVNEKFLADLDALVPGMADLADLADLANLAADVRLGILKSLRDDRELRSDIARFRQELSTFCGLDRPERIGVIGKPSRRVVPVDSLDADYLVSIAQLHRSDLLDLESRLSVAQAELKVSRAAKIPFFTFIDGGWTSSTTTGRTGESEGWSVRAGISLPLFDWVGINKAHLEHQIATEAYSRQIEEQRRLITMEIRAALNRISAAAQELVSYDKDLNRVRADAQKSMEQTSIDGIRSRKTRYQTEELVFKFEEDRYEVWSDYYKAVMELERALGARLERVLNRQ